MGHRLSFTGNRFEIRSKDGKTLYAGPVRIDAGAKPAAIDFENTEKDLKGMWKGIYALKGDTLSICDNAPNMAKDRPATFEATSGSGYVCVTFVTYLFGLIQVSNFVRAAFACGRADVLRMLFCGKIDLQDVPLLSEMAVMGLCRVPRHVPPWVSDPRGVLAILTYSSFMNRIELGPLTAVAERILADTPAVPARDDRT